MFTKTISGLLWLILWMSPLLSKAQLIPNGDFSNHACTGENAFYLGCLPLWQTSHGSPTLSSDNTQQHYAWMFVYPFGNTGSNYGEGIFTSYNFQSGKSYTITMDIRTNDNNDPNIRSNAKINVLAANGLSNNPSTYGGIIQASGSNQVIASTVFNNYADETWTTVSYTFTANANYQQLWIYPDINYIQTETQAELSVDDIRVCQNIVPDASISFDAACSKKDGTISLTVNSVFNADVIHYYQLFEVSTPNATTGGIPVGPPVTGGPNLTSVTFHDLSKDKYYYVKHGIYNDCTAWTEQRLPFSGEVLWTNRTADFTITDLSKKRGVVKVTAEAALNRVDVTHWWGIFLSNNGSTSGNIMVPGTSVQWGPIVTYNGLQPDTWYYLKHGVYNDCAGWIEVRKPFILRCIDTSAGESTVTIEYGSPEETILSPEYIEQTENALKRYPFYHKEKSSEQNISNQIKYDVLKRQGVKDIDKQIRLFPNPSQNRSEINITTGPSTVSKVELYHMNGQQIAVESPKRHTGHISIQAKNTLPKGIYLVKVFFTDSTVETRQAIIE